jgi:hypothetical protein
MIKHNVLNEVMSGLLKKYEKESDMLHKAMQDLHDNWPETVKKYEKAGLLPSDIGRMAERLKSELAFQRKTVPRAISSVTVTDNPTPGVMAKREKD